jgi:hypothetical protein
MVGVVASRTDLTSRSSGPTSAGAPSASTRTDPILQQWKQQYNFVGTYYANIGDNQSSNENFTN